MKASIAVHGDPIAVLRDDAVVVAGRLIVSGSVVAFAAMTASRSEQFAEVQEPSTVSWSESASSSAAMQLLDRLPDLGVRVVSP